MSGCGQGYQRGKFFIDLNMKAFIWQWCWNTSHTVKRSEPDISTFFLAQGCFCLRVGPTTCANLGTTWTQLSSVHWAHENRIHSRNYSAATAQQKSPNFPFKGQLFGLHLRFIIKHASKSDTLKENKEVGQVSRYEQSESAALDQSTLLQLISITVFNSIVETGNAIFSHYLLFLFKD